MNDLWIKSLLFDLNYKFIKIGASLLALAKSIYYLTAFNLPQSVLYFRRTCLLNSLKSIVAYGT